MRYQSPSIERILGYQPEALLGANVFALVHPGRSREPSASARRRSQSTQLHPHGTIPVSPPERTWRLFDAVGRNLLHDKTIAGIVINSRDITERQQTAQQLHLHTAALTAAANSIIIATIDGSSSGSTRRSRRSRLRAEEVIGENPRKLKSGTHPPEFYARMWATIRAATSGAANSSTAGKTVRSTTRT